jgi:tetratricopeptide (TPR) repeat protein
VPKFLPEHVVEKLVGEAFNRLDPAAEQIMQALAVYARPVPPAAIDYLLQPYLPGVDSRAVLNRLVNMHFARREEERYYLHPVDQTYALGRIPKGDEFDRDTMGAPEFTRYALWDRAADYFQEVRKPRAAWKTLNDLAAQLDEFDLRYAGQDYDTAASVLLDIDFDYLLLWGHARRVVELHERLRGKLSDSWLNGSSLVNLGIAYAQIGRISDAIECGEQALAIARETGNRNDEGLWLGNLGSSYADLGQTQQAIAHYEQALAIARETGNRNNEGWWLGNLAEILSDEGHPTEAIQHALDAVKIGNEISSPNPGSYGNGYLALARLYSEDLSAGRAAAEAACQYDVPQNNHYVSALLGVIALRQGNQAAARQSFTVAMDHVETLLSAYAQNYEALDSKGLALCGLGLTEDPKRIAEAVAAYRAARAITKATGIVQRVLRLFDALAQADKHGVLAPVRAAAAGE